MRLNRSLKEEGLFVVGITPNFRRSKPFDGAIREDNSGDGAFDLSRLVLIPILRPGEERIKLEEAVRRGQANPETNWGQRTEKKIWAARERFPESVWPTGKIVIFTSTIWRDKIGNRYVCCIFPFGGGNWHHGYFEFADVVDSCGQFPSLRK